MPALADLVKAVKNRSFDALPPLVKDIKNRFRPPKRKLVPPPPIQLLNFDTSTAVRSYIINSNNPNAAAYNPYLDDPYYNQGTASAASAALGYYNMNSPQQQAIWTTWTTTATTTTTTWTQWNGNVYVAQPDNNVRRSSHYTPPMPAILTPDQIAEQEAQRAEANRRFEAEQVARKTACDMADALLLEHLTPEQREYMKKHNFFVVEGGKSKHKYRIWTNKGYHGNVERLFKDQMSPEIEYCVQLRDYTIPQGDHFLAQKLMFELAEEEMLAIANVSRRYAA